MKHSNRQKFTPIDWELESNVFAGFPGMNRQQETDWPLSVLLAVGPDQERRRQARALRHDGHQVREIRDGVSLIDVFAAAFAGERTAHVDALVLDQGLLGGDGAAFLEGIRRLGWTMGLVLLGESRQTLATAQITPHSVTCLLHKPVDLPALCQAVGACRRGA